MKEQRGSKMKGGPPEEVKESLRREKAGGGVSNSAVCIECYQLIKGDAVMGASFQHRRPAQCSAEERRLL